MLGTLCGYLTTWTNPHSSCQLLWNLIHSAKGTHQHHNIISIEIPYFFDDLSPVPLFNPGRRGKNTFLNATSAFNMQMLESNITQVANLWMFYLLWMIFPSANSCKI